MPHDARKLSDILKEMAEQLPRNPEGDISSEAMHVALMFANFAWNDAVGLDHPKDGAIRFARQAFRAPRKVAEEMVAMAAAHLGMR